jgi:hypothetical protein
LCFASISTFSRDNPHLRILVGSTNKAKVDAAMEILQEYPHLAHAEVSGIPTLIHLEQLEF